MEVCCGFEVEWKEEQGIYYSGKTLVWNVLVMSATKLAGRTNFDIRQNLKPLASNVLMVLHGEVEWV